MNIRGILLILIFIGGIYVMIQSFDEYEEKGFSEITNAMNDPFVALLLNKPTTPGSDSETWIIDDESEIESFLLFIQDYHVRKLNPTEINIDDDLEQFSISLKDGKGNLLTIMVSEDLIIQNATLYYEIVDGPLDIDWLVQFFIHNQI